MKKIIAEVLLLERDFFYPRLYCLSEDGSVDNAVSLTLCDAVWELRGPPLEELLKLVEHVSQKEYMPLDPDFADMCINEKIIFLHSKFAPPGRICISNENVPELSSDEGTPQCFTIEQLITVAELATKFQLEITIRGRENLLKEKMEILLPN